MRIKAGLISHFDTVLQTRISLRFSDVFDDVWSTRKQIKKYVANLMDRKSLNVLETTEKVRVSSWK